MALKLTAVAVAALLAAGAAACGSEDEGTPSACKAPPEDYIEILARAPEGVAFEDGTTISECLVPEQTGGELADVGQSMIEAATQLNAIAREEPTSQASVQLGYLVGAVEKGAVGIHEDLKRRLSSAARFTDDGSLLPAEFERTFGEGYNAGLETG